MLKLTKRAVLIAFLAPMALTSCEKEKEVEKSIEATTSTNTQEIRVQKIKRFITIAFKVSENEIIYSQDNEKVQIKGHEFTKKEIEYLYDNANEYKLVYEN
ncbi:hypothetical protein [Pedobacter africanus]|uniref:Uncharacterized protein n=1 Tax=Pedobacter africanus TaxID=151894 RepID=A0ACC6L3N3_9SPHI|nr:hypothetical protein [Pedobacter africanus]MDR6785977.1 hypothetical protein [Pedobacter africanus]